MSTKSTDNNYNNLHKNLSALTSKIGTDKVSDLLFILSQEGEIAAHGALVKHLASKYFLIPIEEISSGSSHHHSQIRGICFYILNKNNISMRTIGSLFNRSENSVHRQIVAMDELLQRPQSNKTFSNAYAEINAQFLRLKLSREEMLSPVLDNKESKDVNEKLKIEIKKKMKEFNLSFRQFAKLVQMPKSTLCDFMSGKHELTMSYIIKIQNYLNIKII